MIEGLSDQESQEAEAHLLDLKPGGFWTSFHSNEISAWNVIRVGQMKGAYLHASFVRKDGLVAVTLGLPK